MADRVVPLDEDEPTLTKEEEDAIIAALASSAEETVMTGTALMMRLAEERRPRLPKGSWVRAVAADRYEFGYNSSGVMGTSSTYEGAVRSLRTGSQA